MDNRAKDGHMLYGGGVSIPDAALGRDGTCAVQHSQAQAAAGATALKTRAHQADRVLGRLDNSSG